MSDVLSQDSGAIPITKSRRAVSRTAAAVSFGAAAAFLVLLILLHVVKPELDPSWHFISEYSIGSGGWLMQLAFFALALSFATLAYAIRSQPRTLSGRIGLGAALVAAASLAAGGLFTIDPITATQAELTPSGNLHGLASMIGNPACALAALLISLSLARQLTWRPVRRWLLLLGNLPWISLVLMFAVLGITLSQAGGFGPAVPIGWPNRLVVLSYSLWLMTIAWYVLQLSRRQRQTER